MDSEATVCHPQFQRAVWRKLSKRMENAGESGVSNKASESLQENKSN